MVEPKPKRKKRRGLRIALKVVFCILIVITTPSLIAIRLGIFLTSSPPTDIALINFSSCDPQTEAMLSWNTASVEPTNLWIGTNSSNLTAYPTASNPDATGPGTIHRQRDLR